MKELGTPLTVTATVLLSAAMISGCSAPRDQSVGLDSKGPDSPAAAGNSNSETPAPRAGVNVELVRTLWGGSHFSSAQVPQTEDLAKQDFTKLALTGTVVRYLTGPDFTPDSPGGESVIMVVKTLDVFDGTTNQDQNVEVVLVSPQKDATIFTEAIPPGTATALYLQPVPDLPPEVSRGRYVPVSTQAFSVEYGDGVLFPRDMELFRSGSLADQVPAGVDVPE